jgi:hypothetical protein
MTIEMQVIMILDEYREKLKRRSRSTGFVRARKEQTRREEGV